MKKLICLLLCLCFLFALAACGNTEEKTENETTTTAAQGGEDTKATDTQTGTKPGPTPDNEEPPVEDNTVLYTIKVVDEAGNPVAAATIAQICDDVCVPVKLTDGVGEKNLEPNENYHVNLTVMPEGYEYASGETEYPFDSENVCTIVLKAVA